MTDVTDIDAAGALIGSAVERIEDLRLLKGRGTYVDDLTRVGMLHAVILRSPVAHGLIRSIDVSAALALPGVQAVITAEDISRALKGAIPVIPQRQEALPELEPFRQPVIADRKVRYVGEPIAVVVADDAARAEDVLEAIAVDIEPLLVVADRAAAAKKDALLFEGAGTNCALTLSAIRGDADTAFAGAPYTRRERFRVHRHTAVPMETRGLLAEWDEKRGKLTVYGAAKVPFPNRRVLAAQMGIGVDAIEMVEGDVGGAFGVRGEFYPEDFLIPFAARRVGRPVKWIEDRREHLIATNHAREAECELEIACDRDGRILAMRGRAQTDAGAYVRTNGVTPSRNMAQVSSGPYRIPHIHIDVSMMLTNKTPPIGALNLGQVERGGREQLLGRHFACREPLLVVVAQKSLQHVAVRGQAVAPVVLAHQAARLFEFRDAPGKAHEQVPDLPELMHRERLGAQKSLEHAHRQPRMALDERFADTDDVHGRKNLRAAEVVFLDAPVIGEKARDVRHAALEARRCARADDCVELADFEHTRERFAVGHLPQVDLRRQLERRSLAPTGGLEPATAPTYGLGIQPIFVLEYAAYPDVRGDLVFGQADGFSRQGRGAVDIAVGADVHTRMPEQTRHEGRNADVLVLSARGQKRMAADRELGHVEFLEGERAVKRLLRFDGDRQDFTAFYAHAAVEQGPGAIVVTASHTELKRRQV